MRNSIWQQSPAFLGGGREAEEAALHLSKSCKSLLSPLKTLFLKRLFCPGWKLFFEMSHYFLGTPLVSWLNIKFLKRVFCIFVEQLFLPGCKLFSFLANIFSGCLLFSGWKPIFLKRVFFPRSTLVYWKVSSFLTENCFLEMSEKEQILIEHKHALGVQTLHTVQTLPDRWPTGACPTLSDARLPHTCTHVPRTPCLIYTFARNTRKLEFCKSLPSTLGCPQTNWQMNYHFPFVDIAFW